MTIRVNIGCGKTPTPEWYNFDNSPSLRLANHQYVVFVLDKCGMLHETQKEFISFAKQADIKWANATKRIPFSDASVDVLYSSHMIEHLDPTGAKLFLREAYRVLVPNGIVRISVPDIRKLATFYLNNGDANAFANKIYQVRLQHRTIRQKLKFFVIGDRNHQWMYDGKSLAQLLIAMGFKDAKILEPGSTTIPNPGELDLNERDEESVYVEAVRP